MANFQTKYGIVSKASNTQVTLTDSVLKIGGRWQRTGSLTLNTGVSGIGGIDTGSIANSTFYYVYAVSNGSVLGLVASTSESSPVGFTRYKKIGAFYTDGSSNVFKAYTFGEENLQLLVASINAAASSFNGNTSTPWASVSVASSTYTLTIPSTLLTISPAFSCSCNNSNNNNSVAGKTKVVGATSIDYVFATASNTAFSTDHSIFLNKRGVDAVQPDWRDY